MGVEVDQPGKDGETRPVDDRRAVGALPHGPTALDMLGLDRDALAGAHRVRDAVDQPPGFDIEGFGRCGRRGQGRGERRRQYSYRMRRIGVGPPIAGRGAAGSCVARSSRA